MPGSLYDFVRRYLIGHGGNCSREERLGALKADNSMKERLARTRGFSALLNNMRHSGDVTLIGNSITATARTVRRMSARSSP